MGLNDPKPSGGATPSSTRSTSAASPTATATASATCPASPRGCPTCATSASTRCGSRRSTPRRSTTTATTWPTTATSTRCSAPSPTPTRCSTRAHELGLKVIVDLVPNHTSDEHEWFRAALAAGPGSPERARYLFRDGRGRTAGTSRPTTGVGLRRSRVDPGRRTASGTSTSSTPPSPTSNWRNPEVGDMFEDVLRFWLDRGVDGFRVDVAHGLFKEESLRDQVVDEDELPSRDPAAPAAAAWSSAPARRADVGPARGARGLPPLAPTSSTKYDGDRMAVAEAWTQTPGVDGALRPPRRDAARPSTSPGCWRRLVGRRRSPTVITGTLDAVGPGRRHADLGAQQPRRGPARDAVRRRRAGPGPRPGGDAGDAGAARLVVPLPGRGARPRAGRRARRSSGRTRPGSAPASAGRDGCRVPMPWGGTQRAVRLRPGRRASRGSRSPPTGRR